jgi:hypothetical protein
MRCVLAHFCVLKSSPHDSFLFSPSSRSSAFPQFDSATSILAKKWFHIEKHYSCYQEFMVYFTAMPRNIGVIGCHKKPSLLASSWNKNDSSLCHRATKDNVVVISMSSSIILPKIASAWYLLCDPILSKWLSLPEMMIFRYKRDNST